MFFDKRESADLKGQLPRLQMF